MSLADCAAEVEAGDPERFATVMAAPPAARARLWPLYAVNLEIARAPWVAAEPLVAEMRLQWWIDTIGELAEGRIRAGHPVTEGLAPLLAADPGLAPLLSGLAEARRRDCRAEPFADRAALVAYLDATAGGLMWAAARSLGATATAEPAVRDFGRAAGLALWLRAVPELVARGRQPLPDAGPEAIRALAAEGLVWIARGRGALAALPGPVRPALWPAAGAAAVLRRAARDPSRVAAGTLGPSEFTRRFRLLRAALTGRV